MGRSGRVAACVAAISILLFARLPADAQSITDKLGNWLFGKSSTPSDGNESANTAAEVDCPGVTVRQGASTLSITAPGADAGPMTTRYQVSIAQTARECAPLGGVMTMKVGVEGRVLLGPAGGPGQIDVPLRMAVVQEGANPKAIVSKFYKLVVAIPPGQTSVPFVHVEQDLTFPTPRPADFDAYVVYVGFDPASLNTKPERPAKKTKKE
ncbi:MAG: hypothetical protein E6G97_10520 [Alphaproteobacteria bacterium]|nr:MAG: hypothetical protein E6G97_10520 [Alphaproteobacteria bacterium]